MQSIDFLTGNNGILGKRHQMDKKECFNCGSKKYVKNGFVRGNQRYKCKECGYNFTMVPRRGKSEGTKALAILLYSLGKSSFEWIGKLLGVSGVTVYKWVRKTALELPVPDVRNEIKEMELDEMWHFVRSKKTSDGYGKHTIVCEGKLSPGLWVTIVLRPLSVSGSR